MTKETKSVIEALEALRLDMFRSAAYLDKTICEVRAVMDDPHGEEYIKEVVRQAIAFRRDRVNVCNWNKIDERERDLWKRLLDTL